MVSYDVAFSHVRTRNGLYIVLDYVDDVHADDATDALMKRLKKVRALQAAYYNAQLAAGGAATDEA